MKARESSTERAVWITVLGLFATSALAISAGAPTTVAACLSLSFMPYAFAFVHADALDGARAFELARRGALIAGLCMCVAPPVLSDDLFRYLWDGRVLRHGIDPYAYAPSDPALYELRDRYFSRVNHPQIPTIYPPLAQLVFALVGAISYAPFALKLTSLLAHLGTLHAVRRLSHDSPRAVIAFGLNPLALAESALNGHVDALLACALAWAFVALRERRTVRMAGLLAIAAGTKLVGLLFLPLLARHKLRHAALAGTLCALALAPLMWPRTSNEASGAQHYARRWRGNDALYGVLEDGVAAWLRSQAKPAEREQDHIRLARFSGWIEYTRDTALDPWRGAQPAYKGVPDRSDFEIPFLAGLVTRVLVIILVSISTLLFAVLERDPVLAARHTLLFALLLAPQVHPWYLLWLLPFEAAGGRLVAIAWSLSVLVAYAPLDLWQRARIWNETSLAKLCEFGVVVLVFLFEFWVFNKERSDQHARLSTVQDHPHAPGGGLSS